MSSGKHHNAHHNGKASSLERNSFKYSGKVLCRHATTGALRIIRLSPLGASTSAADKHLGFWSVRLSELADTFFEFRFTRFKLRFCGDPDGVYVPTIAVGMQNATSPVLDPTSQYQVMDCSWSHAVMDGMGRPPQCFTIPPQYITPPLTKWLKCTTAADDDFELQGMIYLWANTPAVESYVTAVEIDYAIEFRNPIYIQATPAANAKYLRMVDEEKDDDSVVAISEVKSAAPEPRVTGPQKGQKR